MTKPERASCEQTDDALPSPAWVAALFILHGAGYLFYLSGGILQIAPVNRSVLMYP